MNRETRDWKPLVEHDYEREVEHVDSVTIEAKGRQHRATQEPGDATAFRGIEGKEKDSPREQTEQRDSDGLHRRVVPNPGSPPVQHGDQRACGEDGYETCSLYKVAHVVVGPHCKGAECTNGQSVRATRRDIPD